MPIGTANIVTTERQNIFNLDAVEKVIPLFFNLYILLFLKALAITVPLMYHNPPQRLS